MWDLCTSKEDHFDTEAFNFPSLLIQDIIRSNFKNSPQAEGFIPYMAIRQEFLSSKGVWVHPHVFVRFSLLANSTAFIFGTFSVSQS